MNNEKIIVGLSGGVDSSVAAYLLKKEGYDVTGVTMVHFQGEDDSSQKAAVDAARVAKHLGIPHYTVDCCAEFKDEIMDYFVDEYLHGRTPNPCVVCNRKMKWRVMMETGARLGASLIATGHYARITRLANGRLAVQNSVTAEKDQTYVLYGLSQEQLNATKMPLGEYTKEEIRAIARKEGIPVAEKRDSMEICFIPDKDYAKFIENYAGHVPEKGNYINTSGKILGQHQGIIHYTIGQRKGLNLAMGHPVFVSEIRPDTNEVVIGENEDIFAKSLVCDQINAMAVSEFRDGMEVMAKIRYNHKGAAAVVKVMGKDELRIDFQEPQRAITPGQAVVFYRDGMVAGGGIIKGALKE